MKSRNRIISNEYEISLYYAYQSLNCIRVLSNTSLSTEALVSFLLAELESKGYNLDKIGPFSFSQLCREPIAAQAELKEDNFEIRNNGFNVTFALTQKA